MGSFDDVTTRDTRTNRSFRSCCSSGVRSRRFSLGTETNIDCSPYRKISYVTSIYGLHDCILTSSPIDRPVSPEADVSSWKTSDQLIIEFAAYLTMSLVGIEGFRPFEAAGCSVEACPLSVEACPLSEGPT